MNLPHALLVGLLLSTPASSVSADGASLAVAEQAFESARFWHDQLELTRARGAGASEAGLALAELERRFVSERERARAALETATAANDEDLRALAWMREVMSGELAAPAAPAGGEKQPEADCDGDLVAQAGGGDEPTLLGERLYACYGARAAALSVDGATIDRLSVLARLRAEPDRARRRALFEALLPLGRIVNGDDGARSPYRELVRRTAIVWKRDGSPIDRQVIALGFEPAEFEAALVGFLERWRALQPAEPIEPWDLHHASAEASRRLADTVPPERLEPLALEYLRALGADPTALGVRLDLAPRAGKTPVAFSNFGARRRTVDGVERPTEPWIFATYRAGGFDNLNELVHELGHAVHLAAIDTRPAFLDWPDLDSFTEALAELPALELYEPAWQQRWLGRSVELPVAIRSKYGAIALDVCWALFEIRIHREPHRSPNQLWSELTQRYLGVTPHPEWSWWMLRGQLVSNPGYMANYAIGAVIAADLRARDRETGGALDRDWYGRASATLFRFGRERSARQVLDAALGRKLSAAALLSDLERGSEAGAQVARLAPR